MRTFAAIVAVGMCWTAQGGLAHAHGSASNADRANIRALIGALIAKRAAEQASQSRCTSPLELVANASLNARSAEMQISRLRSEVAKRAKSEAALRTQLDDERARLAAYMTSSDARLAEIKTALQELSKGIAAHQHAARLSIARGIVKSRQHRRALRSLALSEKKLKLAQGAPTAKVTPAATPDPAVAVKPARKPRPKPRKAPSPSALPSFWDD